MPPELYLFLVPLTLDMSHCSDTKVILSMGGKREK